MALNNPRLDTTQMSKKTRVQMNKLWLIHMMKYSMSTKVNELQVHETIWVNNLKQSVKLKLDQKYVYLVKILSCTIIFFSIYISTEIFQKSNTHPKISQAYMDFVQV